MRYEARPRKGKFHKRNREYAVVVDISDIVSCENRESIKEISIGLKSFISRLGEFPIIKAEPVELKLANRENRSILIQGDVSLTVLIPCSRCLKEVSTDICFSVDKEMKLENGIVSGGELEDTGCLAGFSLDVDKLIHEEILVNWPMKILCREDCKGICKTCGQDLNEGDCSCRKTEPDPRMAAIQDIFNKFKEV